MKKRKLEIKVKCDYCGNYTASFVVNVEYKYTQSLLGPVAI